MRASEFIRHARNHTDELDEMAMSKYQTFGDFTKPGPFRGADKRLVPHPTNRLQAQKFFERTDYDFRLFFSNIPGTGKYREYGPMSPEKIRQVFPADAASEIIDGHENSITVVYVGNSGDAKVPLTPWMMAHRFGHAVNAGSRGQQRWHDWLQLEEYFFNSVNSKLADYYGKQGRKDDTFRFKLSLYPEYRALFNFIGTQKSSRKKKITRPYEFVYELLAQYIESGQITLNPLPEKLGYGKMVFGRPSQYMRINPEYQDLENRQYASDILANDMQMMFDNVLANSVGKIFVM